MKTIFLLLVIGYLVSCILLFVFQRSFIYYPQPAGEIGGVAEISFAHENQSLNGWVLNKGQSRALIYYGGNAESIENNIDFFRRAMPGYTVYLIPYRGYGKNAGAPTEKKLYADALFVFDQIKIQHDNITLMGRSLGSGIATYVAVKRSIHKLLLITPFDSVENIAKKHFPFFPVSLLVTDKYLSHNRAPDIKVPTLVLIAENDQIIPKEHTEELVTKLNPELLTKAVISEAEHNDISMYPEYLEAIVQFVD